MRALLRLGKKMVSKRLKFRLGFSFFDIRAKNQEHTS